MPSAFPLFFTNLLFLLLNFYVHPPVVQSHTQHTVSWTVQFDLNYGGLHTTARIFPIRFGTFFKEIDNCHYNDTGCFDVMLSTVHRRTFLVDDRPGKCDEEEEKDEKNASSSSTMTMVRQSFCKNHHKRFNLDLSQSKRAHEQPIPIINPVDGQQIGVRVEDLLEIDHDLKVHYQKIELMNSRAATLPSYWGIKVDNNGEILQDNMADGCLSLMGGELTERDPGAFDTNSWKPMQRFVDYGLIDSTLTIRLQPAGKIVQSNETIYGTIKFGGLSTDSYCNDWHFLKKNAKENASLAAAAKEYWSFKIDSIDGLKYAKDQQAIIDTTTQQIGVPWAHWDALAEHFFFKIQSPVAAADGGGLFINCADVEKLPVFRLNIDGLWYTVEQWALLAKKDGNTCHFLIGKNAQEEDPRWHLGVPFLVNHCVAKDFFSWGGIWLSNGAFSDPKTSNNNGAGTHIHSFIVLSNLLACLSSIFLLSSHFLSINSLMI